MIYHVVSCCNMIYHAKKLPKKKKKEKKNGLSSESPMTARLIFIAKDISPKAYTAERIMPRSELTTNLTISSLYDDSGRVSCTSFMAFVTLRSLRYNTR